LPPDEYYNQIRVTVRKPVAVAYHIKYKLNKISYSHVGESAHLASMSISETFRRPAPSTEQLPHLRPTLAALLEPIDAEGAAVIDHKDSEPVLLCVVGDGSATILRATDALVFGISAPHHSICFDGRPVLVAPWQPPSGRKIVIAFWRKAAAKPWSTQDHRLIVVAAAALGALPLNAARSKEAAWRGVVDDLTGLPRARKLVEDLPRHYARLDRDGLPGTLIIASVDGFKRIHEAFGRGASDELLREVAKFFQGLARPTDVVARIGGDEFAIWFNGVDQVTAAERAEQLKADAPFLAAALQKPELYVSFSVGIATRQPGSNEAANSLIRRADIAMHQAKDAGFGNWRVSQEKAG
jgi:diguanylate cyclase (GGDEF)-like protein